MQRPDSFDTMRPNVPKQHRKIDIAPVDRMQVDDIWRERFYLCQQPPCRDPGEAPVKAADRLTQHIHLSGTKGAYLCIVMIRFSMSVRRRHRRKALHFMPCFFRGVGNTEHDPSGAAENAPVDLNNS